MNKVVDPGTVAPPATALETATAAVVKAEVTKLQADVDAATLLVNALPADVAPVTFKQDLSARLAAIVVAPIA